MERIPPRASTVGAFDGSCQTTLNMRNIKTYYERNS